MNLGCVFVAALTLAAPHHSLHTNTQRVRTALPTLWHYLVNQSAWKLRLETVTCYELLCFHTTFSVLKETKIGHRDGSACKGCCQEKHSDWSSITDTRIKMEAENRLQENCTLISACAPSHTHMHTYTHAHTYIPCTITNFWKTYNCLIIEKTYKYFLTNLYVLTFLYNVFMQSSILSTDYKIKPNYLLKKKNTDEPGGGGTCF